MRRFAAALPRLVRFAVVGALNTLVDLAVLNLLLYLFAEGDSHARLFPVLATVSFAVATLNSFLWNRNWTFREKRRAARRELPQFYLVTAVSFLVNVGISSLLVWWSPFALNATVWANVAKLIATGVSLMLNFLGYHKLVFRRMPGHGHPADS